MKTNSKADITFGIRGDRLDPEQVSNFLGLQPSHAFSKGESYESAVGTRHRPFGVWQLRSESAVNSLDLEEHAAFILSQLESHKDRIENFLSDPSLYVDIRIWWEYPSETGGFTLSSNTIHRLASLCKEFNFTYIASCANDGESSERTSGPSLKP